MTTLPVKYQIIIGLAVVTGFFFSIAIISGTIDTLNRQEADRLAEIELNETMKRMMTIADNITNTDCKITNVTDIDTKGMTIECQVPPNKIRDISNFTYP